MVLEITKNESLADIVALPWMYNFDKSPYNMITKKISLKFQLAELSSYNIFHKSSILQKNIVCKKSFYKRIKICISVLDIMLLHSSIIYRWDH